MKMNLTRAVLPAFCILMVLAACDKPSSLDNTKNRALSEQEAANESQNENLARKAKLMEADLQSRFHFYEANSGMFEGKFNISGYDIITKLELAPSIAIAPSERVRTLEEIQQDINNLSMKAQVTFINSKTGRAVGGCTFDGMKAFLKEGIIPLKNESCKNRYTLSLSDGKSLSSPELIKKVREALAAQTLSGEIKQINSFYLEVRIANDAKIQKLLAIRKLEAQ